jgi:hypothetical protein
VIGVIVIGVRVIMVFVMYFGLLLFGTRVVMCMVRFDNTDHVRDQNTSE